ncbi:hypothetical protein [Noviherbaspirillum sp. UKPF54]|uniref:hypothetical protein n=1 Tax=Noviherbaspirillum sp. UKPF54 TaxID=2601898 RepID=UPI0011B10050|nr:hypothetical protein [Noviherbaspirillum sp. UKPF54]QDZ26561.1 hypothetical protein FAY22_00410 [Noviherbaspirillum sp. UKPF54]
MVHATTQGNSNFAGTTAAGKSPSAHDKEVKLIKTAATDTGHTKKAIMAALRAIGLAGNPANVERVQELRADFEMVRAQRFCDRASARLSQPVPSLPTPSGRAPVLLPKGTPSKRLTALRIRAISAHAKGAFRHGAPGGTRFTVGFASCTSKVNYSVELGRNYDVYRGAYKGWGANVDNHQICVPADWRLRVERKGLANLGGLLTLDVLPMESPAGIALYDAVWASQGRGYDVRTERGFIAKSGDEHFHGDTPENAIAGLLRKCRILKKHMATVADLSSSVDSFIAKFSASDVKVSLDDARQTGSCEYGIRSWCQSVGIDIARVKVPVTEILEGFRKLPLSEVRRAVLFAARRHRVRLVNGS